MVPSQVGRYPSTVSDSWTSLRFFFKVKVRDGILNPECGIRVTQPWEEVVYSALGSLQKHKQVKELLIFFPLKIRLQRAREPKNNYDKTNI